MKEGNLKLTRRGFLEFLLTAGGAGLFAATLYPLIKYIIPPKGTAATPSSVVAAKIDSLSPNNALIFRFGDKPAILINTPQETLKAFSAVCTHLNCTLQYNADSSNIWCACHNGNFDLNGQVISGPPPKPLEEYKVFVRGDEIVVSKG